MKPEALWIYSVCSFNTDRCFPCENCKWPVVYRIYWVCFMVGCMLFVSRKLSKMQPFLRIIYQVSYTLWIIDVNSKANLFASSRWLLKSALNSFHLESDSRLMIEIISHSLSRVFTCSNVFLFCNLLHCCSAPFISGIQLSYTRLKSFDITDKYLNFLLNALIINPDRA